MTDVDPIAYRAVVPYLNVKDGWAAVRFYKDAFGAEEVVSLERAGGRLAHAELRIGEAVFMVREEYPEYGYLSPATIGGTPVNLLV
jgi:PhnB protein